MNSVWMLEIILQRAPQSWKKSRALKTHSAGAINSFKTIKTETPTATADIEGILRAGIRLKLIRSTQESSLCP